VLEAGLLWLAMAVLASTSSSHCGTVLALVPRRPPPLRQARGAWAVPGRDLQWATSAAVLEVQSETSVVCRGAAGGSSLERRGTSCSWIIRGALKKRL
jgi:hypothetical protein